MAEPISLGAATLWAGLASAAGQGVQAGMTAGRNRKQRKWQTDQYWLERKHMMEDFHRTNQYNSPESQMQRFKEAGLSPHLIYGQGSSGLASAPNSPSMGNPDIETPDITGIGHTATNTLNQFVNTKQIEEQTKNLAQQNKNLRADEVNSLIEAGQKWFDLKMDESTSDWEIKKRQNIAESGTSRAAIDAMDQIMYKTLYKEQVTQAAEDFQQKTSAAVLQNWKNLSELKIHQANPQLFKTFVEAGMSEGAAKMALTYAQAELTSMQGQYYEPQIIMNAISKVVGMIPGIGMFNKAKGATTNQRRAQQTMYSKPWKK
nr:MAG: DNA pilot protein [Microvirus sp.]